MNQSATIDLPRQDVASSDPKVRELLETTQKKLGFIPNMYGNMANAPHLLESYLFGYDLFRSRSGLTSAEQEVVLLTISRHNHCEYCIAAHTLLAEKVSNVPPEVTQAIRDDTEIHDEKLRSLSLFVRTLLEKRGWLEQHDVDSFLHSGYQQTHVLDILLAVSVKTISNYANHLFATPVDDIFKAHEWHE